VSETTKRTWNDDEKLGFEVWKYYGGIGGADKDYMIKIVTWLLGFSASIIGALATGKLADSLAAALLVVLGMSVSTLAAFTSLLYGAYAAWNWAIADRIAEIYDWTEQSPTYRPIPRSKTQWMTNLAKPCQGRIAPVFWVFFSASFVSFIVHAVLLYHRFLQHK